MLGGDKISAGGSSIATESHAFMSDARIEEEIAEEMNKMNAQDKSVPSAADLDDYSDDENFAKMASYEGDLDDDNAIVDETAEDEALQLLEAEICNTALAKQDMNKVKSLISKIDTTLGSKDKDKEKETSSLASKSTYQDK